MGLAFSKRFFLFFGIAFVINLVAFTYFSRKTEGKLNVNSGPVLTVMGDHSQEDESTPDNLRDSINCNKNEIQQIKQDCDDEVERKSEAFEELRKKLVQIEESATIEIKRKQDSFKEVIQELEKENELLKSQRAEDKSRIEQLRNLKKNLETEEDSLSTTTTGTNKKILVGFLQMVTGRYTQFIDESYQSFEKHMFVNSTTHDFRIVYFTNQKEMINYPKAIYMNQERLQWPYDSMNRNDVYLSNRYLLEQFDYLVALDIDLVWYTSIEPDLILNDFVTVIHVGYNSIKGKGSFESRPESQAYFYPKFSECYYVMGGYFGGRSDVFFNTLETIWGWKKKDQEVGIVPVYHDESYLNRYVCENYGDGEGNDNITFLPCGFLQIEGLENNDTKISHLNKNHNEIREIV